jgi:alpha-tubulin suppressor-like RCC1 family protein
MGGCAEAVRPGDDPMDGFVATDAVEVTRDTPEPDSGALVATGSTLAAGDRHSCARRASGQVLCWGNNEYGQLGQDTAELDHVPPAAVADLADAVEVAAGGVHTCARRASGQVLCWGQNLYGQLGDGSSGTNRATPAAVPGLADAVEVAAGRTHTCARRASGQVLCWGENGWGLLGDGTTRARTRPVAVAGVTDAVEVAAGERHTCARRAAGPVLCWGDNRFGALGGDPTAPSFTPVVVQGL